MGDSTGGGAWPRRMAGADTSERYPPHSLSGSVAAQYVHIVRSTGISPLSTWRPRVFLRPRPHAGAAVGVALALIMVLCAPAPAGTPGCAIGSPPLRYVVLFEPGTPEPAAEQAVSAACGTNTAYYPQIGVAVATSADPGFTAHFGSDRAYSARAETLAAWAAAPAARTAPGAGRTGRAVPRTAQDLPEQPGQVLRTDRSAEQWGMELISGPQARAINPGSPEVLVGVLDSGIDATHPDLAGAVDPARSAGCLSGAPDPEPSAWSPTTSRHGTHVAGTIAADDDGQGVAGVAPGVRLASIKVVDDDGFIYPEYAVCGFMWAARAGVRVANSSFVVNPWLRTCSDRPGQMVVHEAVRRAVEYATTHGVLIIAAVGNDQMDLSRDVRRPPVYRDCDVLPAELPGVVAVSALGAYGAKSVYSSYGLGVVAVTAPGGDPAQRPEVSSSGCVLSTIPGGYGYACGTSMAAPHVSGVAALLASSRAQAGPAELAALLRRQADPLRCPSRPAHDSGSCTGGVINSYSGHGLVNALTAVTSRNRGKPGSEPGTPARRG